MIIVIFCYDNIALNTMLKPIALLLNSIFVKYLCFDMFVFISIWYVWLVKKRRNSISKWRMPLSNDGFSGSTGSLKKMRPVPTCTMKDLNLCIFFYFSISIHCFEMLRIVVCNVSRCNQPLDP